MAQIVQQELVIRGALNPGLAQCIALHLNFLDLAHVIPVVAVTRATAQAYLVILAVGPGLRPGKTVSAAQERHNPINKSEQGEHYGLQYRTTMR